MKFLQTDIFRSFMLGFGVTAIAMTVNLLPQFAA